MIQPTSPIIQMINATTNFLLALNINPTNTNKVHNQPKISIITIYEFLFSKTMLLTFYLESNNTKPVRL